MFGNFNALNRLPQYVFGQKLVLLMFITLIIRWESASMTVEVSERSATRRLLQCRDFGLQLNDVSKRFQQPGSDLSENEFRERNSVVEDVQRHNASNGSNTWTPILYKFEVCCSDSCLHCRQGRGSERVVQVADNAAESIVSLPRMIQVPR